MLKLVVYVIVLTAVCSAQEHLTCLRTDDVLNRQSQQHPQRALQGSPGKRGPRGQMGSRGRPGQKGEPGIPDDQQIKLLRDQLDSLSQEVEALKNQSRKIVNWPWVNSSKDCIFLLTFIFINSLLLVNRGSKVRIFVEIGEVLLRSMA